MRGIAGFEAHIYVYIYQQIAALGGAPLSREALHLLKRGGQGFTGGNTPKKGSKTPKNEMLTAVSPH